MKIVLAVLTIVVFFYVLVRFLEKTSIFYPARQIDNAPDRFGLPYEDIYFTAEDGVKLNGTSTVVTTDIQCTNGVIHVIDSVLIPA